MVRGHLAQLVARRRVWIPLVMAAVCLGLSETKAQTTGAAQPAGATTTSPAQRPNVVLIVSDDQGYGDLACHGNPVVRTPHLDQLYRQSVRLTDFHVDPTCSPTRAALLTGRYSTRTGVWHTIMGRSILSRHEQTLPEIFAAHGYQTAIFGKWHLGDNYPARPEDRGFQHSLILGGGGVGQTPDFWGNDYFDDHYRLNGQWQPFSGYCADVFFREALNFVQECGERPFFVYIPSNTPHGPYNVADELRRPYAEQGLSRRLASFYGMIENLDQNVGQFLLGLDRLGQSQNTLVIFMTDNGSAEGATEVRANEAASTADAGAGAGAGAGGGALAAGRFGWSAGMRGVKGSVYDGGHRVPLFLRWPAGGLKAGSDIAELTAHFDLLPTLVELCGLSFTPVQPLDGVSLVPLLRGSVTDWPERTLFVHTQRAEVPPKWTHSAVMTERWRLDDGTELYDIMADPAQEHDMAADFPAEIERLRQAYEQWWSTLEPSLTQYSPIVVGSDQENPSHLTCMDWHADDLQIPWDQGHIRKLPAANGWWMIDVDQAGKYAVTLRHQPEVAQCVLRASEAVVRVGEREQRAEIPRGATAVTLQIELPAGPARLETQLNAPEAQQSRGAFFVEIERLADGC